ncbi:MAG TPA: glycosyl transferase family 2 [Lachnospiraceae bacterium]|nr:glycosyl transferase family 2 [Lachnospiraceae bacterium]
MEFSLCMIVKNEERVLERCLRSLHDLMDEIIIVDTGSTDSTKEIARRYTDKVYDFEWIDDFSAARNFAFSHATKDYIYSADADEVLDEENWAKFDILKRNLIPEIEIVQMIYGNQLESGTAYNFDAELRPKLFKRLRTFTWIEPVHEQMRLDPIVYDSDIVITHKPEGLHSGRDYRIFLKEFREGRRLSKHLHHMYAMELYISGKDEDFLEAEELFRESACDEKRSIDEVREAACVVCHAARLRGDADTLLKYSMKDMLSEGSSEMCCELGHYFFDRGDYEEAAMWFYNAMNEAEPILSVQAAKEWPQKGYDMCAEKLGISIS